MYKIIMLLIMLNTIAHSEIFSSGRQHLEKK